MVTPPLSSPGSEVRFCPPCGHPRAPRSWSRRSGWRSRGAGGRGITFVAPPHCPSPRSGVLVSPPLSSSTWRQPGSRPLYGLAEEALSINPKLAGTAANTAAMAVKMVGCFSSSSFRSARFSSPSSMPRHRTLVLGTWCLMLVPPVRRNAIAQALSWFPDNPQVVQSNRPRIIELPLLNPNSSYRQSPTPRPPACPGLSSPQDQGASRQRATGHLSNDQIRLALRDGILVRKWRADRIPSDVQIWHPPSGCPSAQSGCTRSSRDFNSQIRADPRHRVP